MSAAPAAQAPVLTATRTMHGKSARVHLYADGVELAVLGGNRALRAQAVIVTQWPHKALGASGLRQDLHAAEVEAHRLVTATSMRTRGRYGVPGSSIPLNRPDFAAAVPVTDPATPTPTTKESTDMTSTAAATRNATTKTVGKGEADAMRKGRQAAAKVQANADAVAALNSPEGVVEVVEGKGGVLRAHRITCNRHAVGFETTAFTAVNLHHAVPASCCKPQLPEPTTATAEPEAPAPSTDGPQASTDRMERLQLAKTEAKALKSWEADGSQGERPSTVNLDAVSAKAPTTKAGSAAKPVGRTSSRSAEYQAAMQKKAAGKRGRGTKLTDEALAAHVATMRQAHPEYERNEGLEIAYWLDGLAVTRDRWATAWAAADNLAKAS